MTQDDYTLFTGECSNFSDTSWKALVDVAEKRLASLLCLETFPTLDGTNQDLKMLLANFICAMLKFQGMDDIVESKSVRNFNIKFKENAANAFEQIHDQYADIIERYSDCGTGIKVERCARHCCGYYNNGYLNI